MMGNVHSVSPAYVEMVTEINSEVANIATMSTLGLVISYLELDEPCMSCAAVEELKTMHQARLRVGFDQEAERQKVRPVLESPNSGVGTSLLLPCLLARSKTSR